MSLIANSTFIGWTLLVSGVIFIVSYIFLWFMFSRRTPPWGALNDVTYALALFLIIPFLVGIYEDLLAVHPVWALLALLIGVVGIALIIYTQVSLVRGMIKFSINLRQGAFGAGLLGIAFIINHLSAMSTLIIPFGLNRLALSAGILMSMGIWAALFYGEEEYEMMTGRLNWRIADRLGLTVIFAAFLGQIALLVWVFLMAFSLIF